MDYSHLKKSLKNLEQRFKEYHELDESLPTSAHEAYTESAIKRFEICYDCLLKALARHMKDDLGIANVPSGANPILRMANENCLLDSPLEERWFLYVKMRNKAAQEYGLEDIGDVLEQMGYFIQDAINVYKIMSGDAWSSEGAQQ